MPTDQKKEQQLKKSKGADRRRTKALALYSEQRKRQRRTNTANSQQERREIPLVVDVDPRRRGKRGGFFCPVTIYPEKVLENGKGAVKGTILDISSNGMAIALENSGDWFALNCDVKVAWNSETTVSCKIIWDRVELNYLNMGKTRLIGVALYERHENKPNTKNIITPPSAARPKSLNSISDLTELNLYHLYIGGKDIETGLYGFAANAHKLISDPIETRNILEILSDGFIPDRYVENAYAAYSIANDINIQQATEAAYVAWQEFRYVTTAKKRRIFREIHESIKNNRSQLIDLMVREGHPIRLAEWEFKGMVKATEPKTVDFYLEQLFKKVGVDDDEHLFLARKSDGVVCVLPPGNAPCPNSLLVAFALLAGNTLIIKPPLRNPVSTMYLWRRVICDVLESNKVPPGTVNLVIGDSDRILNCWLSSAKVSDIVYFGDSRKGLEIGARIYASGKKPILELSGNDTMIVWNDADLEGAATSLVDGFLGSMQICMAARRAIVHPEVYDKFEAIVLNKVREISAGLPNEERTHLAAVGKIEEFYGFLMDALNHGARLIYGGTRIDHTGRPNPRGTFITPAVLKVTDIIKAQQMKCSMEEGFFPLVTLINVTGKTTVPDSNEEIFTKMVNFLEKNKYGLRTSFWVESARYRRKFVKQVDNSGLLRINTLHTGFSALVGTHGGPGRSGGPFGELNYLWEKTSHLQGICFKEKAIKKYGLGEKV